MAGAFGKFVTILFLIVSNAQLLSSQDSIIVSQDNSVLFSNQYIFFSNGRFKHYYQTDDGQIWYGAGKYTDNNQTRVLWFGDPDTTFEARGLSVHYESNFSRNLKKYRKKFRSADFYNTTRKKYVSFSQ